MIHLLWETLMHNIHQFRNVAHCVPILNTSANACSTFCRICTTCLCACMHPFKTEATEPSGIVSCICAKRFAWTVVQNGQAVWMLNSVERINLCGMIMLDDINLASVVFDFVFIKLTIIVSRIESGRYGEQGCTNRCMHAQVSAHQISAPLQPICRRFSI